jgi:D-sedoheptulose 7-phosphate isomerase
VNGNPTEAVKAHLLALADELHSSADLLASQAADYARRLIATFEKGGRLLLCGNGGSAATVEHIATEYVIRLKRDRDPLPAIALTTGSAQLTASANDFGYSRAFVRPLVAFGKSGDLLVLHSTSGDSENLLAAASAASSLGIGTIALLGESGGRLGPLVDLPIRVPSGDTARVQEMHLALEHAVADLVDAHFASTRIAGEEIR